MTSLPLAGGRTESAHEGGGGGGGEIAGSGGEVSQVFKARVEELRTHQRGIDPLDDGSTKGPYSRHPAIDLVHRLFIRGSTTQ